MEPPIEAATGSAAAMAGVTAAPRPAGRRLLAEQGS